MYSRNKEVSFWQPVPANGYVTIKLQPSTTGSDIVSMGTQTVGVGGYVREHAHPVQDEIILVLDGTGYADIEDIRHEMSPGVALFIPKAHRHSFINSSETELTFAWTITPGFGLSEFFEKIGRPRLSETEVPPQPFARPQDVKQLEEAYGFSKVRQPE